MSLLSPAVVAAIENLELAARIIVEGMRAGGHRSPFHGFSTEFRQHRSYRPGDDLKHLDWKVYARTDRLYTRQFRETTNLSVSIVLDSSASMGYPDTGVSKFRYAQIVAAALAYLATEEGHAIGLVTTQSDRVSYLPPRGGRPHLRSVIARIDRQQANGTWSAPKTIARATQLLRRRGVLLVISDFYDDEEETQRALRRAAQWGHDTAKLQVLSRDELALPFSDHMEMVDAESGIARLVDGAAQADAYRGAMAAFLDRCRTAARRDGVDYGLLVTDTPPAAALREYLLKRGHRPPVHGVPRARAR
jgi:uncharacterized protein (DUF58 family)